MIKGITYSGIFRNVAGFCKLVAQNWHKNLPSCVRVVIFLAVNPIAEINYSMWFLKKNFV